jgi:hypothetical protein
MARQDAQSGAAPALQRCRLACVAVLVCASSLAACTGHPVSATGASQNSVTASPRSPIQPSGFSSALRAHLGPPRGIVAAALTSTMTDARALRVCRQHQVTTKSPVTAALDTTLGQVQQAANPGTVDARVFTDEGPLTKYVALCTFSFTPAERTLAGGFNVGVVAMLDDGSGSSFFVYVK